MTLLPLIAQAAARLAATKVLPSPGSGLVTAMIGHGCSTRMTRRLVRRSRTASAICDWGACTMAMDTSPERTSASWGSSARIGRVGDGVEVGAVPDPVVELLADQGDPAAGQQPGDDADGQQLGACPCRSGSPGRPAATWMLA